MGATLQDILGTSLPVFIGLTVFLFGLAAFLSGQAIAGTWRPPVYAVLAALLLGLADRFLTYALFDGDLLSASGFVASAAVLSLIALFAHRVTLVRKMVTQYPWLYVQSSLFTWRAIREEQTSGNT